MPDKITQARSNLLIQLESIIGNECFNASIENYGPGGVRVAPGRNFKYPITLRKADGSKLKSNSIPLTTNPEVLMTGYYAFGANQLDIINGLNKIIDYLEANHGLSLDAKN